MPERSDLVAGMDLTPHHRKELLFHINNGLLSINKILDVNKKEYFIINFTQGIKKYGHEFLLSKSQLIGVLNDNVEIYDIYDQPLELTNQMKSIILNKIN